MRREVDNSGRVRVEGRQRQQRKCMHKRLAAFPSFLPECMPTGVAAFPSFVLFDVHIIEQRCYPYTLTQSNNLCFDYCVLSVPLSSHSPPILSSLPLGTTFALKRCVCQDSSSEVRSFLLWTFMEEHLYFMEVY